MGHYISMFDAEIAINDEKSKLMRKVCSEDVDKVMEAFSAVERSLWDAEPVYSAGEDVITKTAIHIAEKFERADALYRSVERDILEAPRRVAPCPFCGGRPTVIADGEKVFVACDKCRVKGLAAWIGGMKNAPALERLTCLESGVASAVAWWNKRSLRRRRYKVKVEIERES